MKSLSLEWIFCLEHYENHMYINLEYSEVMLLYTFSYLYNSQPKSVFWCETRDIFCGLLLTWAIGIWAKFEKFVAWNKEDIQK